MLENFSRKFSLYDLFWMCLLFHYAKLCGKIMSQCVFLLLFTVNEEWIMIGSIVFLIYNEISSALVFLTKGIEIFRLSNFENNLDCAIDFYFVFNWKVIYCMKRIVCSFFCWLFGVEVECLLVFWPLPIYNNFVLSIQTLKHNST